MKKFTLALLLAAVIFILLGASVWEGAAAVSMDFPESGLYAATNSFPKNSVVDLTNLETGKTVRVIITSGLDTPGLLALVSQEAAEAIGLRSRTIGRIRMIAPQDPIAFSRFSEEYLSGDPDYDPLAAVENVYGKDTVTPADTSIALDEPDNAWDDTDIATTPILPEDTADIVGIVDIVDIVDTADMADMADGSLAGDVFPVDMDDIPDTADTIDLAADAWDPIPAEPDLDSEDLFIDIPETSDAIAMVPSSRDPVLTDLPVDIIPAPVDVIVPEPVITPPPEEPVYTPTPADTLDYSYTLIPAEERPPEPAYIQPGTTVPQIFSVPAVSELEHGKYYLQLGAYSQSATVEQELSKIGKGYPLTVQSIVLSGKPVYRILIGPVNQGESGALLKQFHARGYKDAFIKRAQ